MLLSSKIFNSPHLSTCSLHF